MPHHEIETDNSNLAGSVRDRAKAGIDFFWLGENGLHKAPKAQLILYPKYPEVRMSGFLMGCSEAPSGLMRQRLEGRVLFFGVTVDERIVGYVSPPEAELTNEFLAFNYQTTGVFSDRPIYCLQQTTPEKSCWTNYVTYQRWVDTVSCLSSGLEPYRAPNGGGYTLEAMLGITPNGFAEPDFMGWEVKQYSVNNFEKFVAKTPVTIFTPEPTGGFTQFLVLKNLSKLWIC